jgi:hypothetical protein
MNHFISAFAIVEHILRDRTGHFAAIGRSENLRGKIVDMLTVMVLGLGLFGTVMGLTGGLPWMLASTVKLPLLFFASLLICVPTLYHFSLLFGGRLTFTQTITLLLTAVTVTAVVCLGFALISLFFFLSGSDYYFMVILDVTMLAVAASAGLIFLVQGALYLGQTAPSADVTFSEWARFFVVGSARSLVLVGWIGLFAVVGTQMSWTLRPFFGAPGSSFVLLRPVQGNFGQALLYTVERLLMGG